MHITDPVADMLTRIRNAVSAKHDTVDVPASNMKKSIAQILLDEGYIKAFELVEELDEKLGNSRSRSMNILSAATYYRDVLVPAMEELRGAVDAMEVHVSAERWPYPTYADLMFRV